MKICYHQLITSLKITYTYIHVYHESFDSQLFLWWNELNTFLECWMFSFFHCLFCHIPNLKIPNSIPVTLVIYPQRCRHNCPGSHTLSVSSFLLVQMSWLDCQLSNLTQTVLHPLSFTSKYALMKFINFFVLCFWFPILLYSVGSMYVCMSVIMYIL